MSAEINGAKRYFGRITKEWHDLYSHENWLEYMINRLLRKGLYERFNLTFEHCGEISGAKVLDIGCGTGQYSIEFAQRGAAKVVGIDFAPAMVAFSQQRAREMEVADQCEFICGDFSNSSVSGPFDIVVAQGFFDYIREPEPIFKKISSLTRGRFLASFPEDSLFWGTQRKIRYYWIKKCPIYFYTANKLEGLYRKAQFSEYKIISLKRGFFGIGINS